MDGGLGAAAAVNSSGPNVSRSSSGPMTIAQIVGVANPQPMPTSDAAAASLPADYERCAREAHGRGGGARVDARARTRATMPRRAAAPCAPTTAPQHTPGACRYEKIEKLGEGTYGVVYKAKDKFKNRFVALKKVRMDAWEDGVPAIALREISVLKEVRHAHIVGLDDVFVSFTGNLYLVFELLDRDLKQFMDAGYRERGMDAALVKALMFQLLSGIEACHVVRACPPAGGAGSAAVQGCSAGRVGRAHTRSPGGRGVRAPPEPRHAPTHPPT
jgi:hypothetical protein